MDANERIRLIREQASKAKGETETTHKPVLIPTQVVTEDAVEVLPTTFKPNKFLSITRNGGTATQETLLSKFEIQPEVYEAMEVTEEQGKKINKSLGRMVTGVASSVPIVCRGDACSYKEKCITGDSLVLTKKGLTPIKDVEVGTKVYSVNIGNLLVESDIITEKQEILNKHVYRINTKGGNSIRATTNHPFLAKTGKKVKWLQIETGLEVGSEIFVLEAPNEHLLDHTEGDLFLDTITSISYEGVETVYDITIKNNSNFVANNFIVHNCPFYEENVHVVGEPCPIEVSLIETWAKDYMDELNIDPNSITEVQTLSRLLEISIIERRLTEYISIHDQDLTYEFVASVDPAGNEIKNKGPSIAFEQREKLDRAKMKLLESLNATRERKAKLKAQVEESTKVDTSMLDIKNTVLDIAQRLKAERDAKVVGNG